jgi:hypothetical protein
MEISYSPTLLTHAEIYHKQADPENAVEPSNCDFHILRDPAASTVGDGKVKEALRRAVAYTIHVFIIAHTASKRQGLLNS